MGQGRNRAAFKSSGEPPKNSKGVRREKAAAPAAAYSSANLPAEIISLKTPFEGDLRFISAITPAPFFRIASRMEIVLRQKSGLLPKSLRRVCFLDLSTSFFLCSTILSKIYITVYSFLNIF